MLLIRRNDLTEIIYTVLGIIAAALVGYVIKLKKDNRSKDDFINTIATKLSFYAKANSEDSMEKSANRYIDQTTERIEFMRALQEAENAMDGADEVIRADGELSEMREPSPEIAERVGDLTSDPYDAPSSLDIDSKEELSDSIKRLAAEQAERLKERL